MSLSGYNVSQTLTGNNLDTSLQWCGNYSATVYYAINSIVYYNGSAYICISGCLGQVPTNALSWDVFAQSGSSSISWQGVYSSTSAYVINNIVYYNGSSYICILANTGHLPTNATYWNLIVEQGATGINGLWQGNYNGTAPYVINDLVYYGGSTYICTVSNTGQLPTNTGYWNIFASAGQNGSNGTNGQDGATATIVSVLTTGLSDAFILTIGSIACSTIQEQLSALSTAVGVAQTAAEAAQSTADGAATKAQSAFDKGNTVQTNLNDLVNNVAHISGTEAGQTPVTYVDGLLMIVGETDPESGSANGGFNQGIFQVGTYNGGGLYYYHFQVNGDIGETWGNSVITSSTGFQVTPSPTGSPVFASQNPTNTVFSVDSAGRIIGNTFSIQNTTTVLGVTATATPLTIDNSGSINTNGSISTNSYIRGNSISLFNTVKFANTFSVDNNGNFFTAGTTSTTGDITTSQNIYCLGSTSVTGNVNVNGNISLVGNLNMFSGGTVYANVTGGSLYSPIVGCYQPMFIDAPSISIGTQLVSTQNGSNNITIGTANSIVTILGKVNLNGSSGFWNKVEKQTDFGNNFNSYIGK